MKAWVKSLICISLSFMCLFACVGYASVTGDLLVRGTIEAKPPQMIFIKNVSGGAYLNPDKTMYSGTVLATDVTLINGEAVYTVTVFNNTDVTYYYSAMVRATDSSGLVVYNNSSITMSVEGIARGDSVLPGETRTFTVKARFKSGADTSNPNLYSVIEYRFSETKPTSSANDEAVTGVLAAFPVVLNSPDTYSLIKDTMMARNGRTSASYIGNVKGADSADVATIKTLFGDTLTLNVDGQDIPVSLMIKIDNIDGNESTGDSYEGVKILGISQTRKGGEMTLYITADPLTSSGKDAVVYALVYTKNQTTGEWYLLGETYQGEAPIRGYDSLFNTGTGSFYTDGWESVAKTYYVTSNYSYSISKGTSIGDIVKAKDTNANNELKRLVQKAQDIVSDGRYFGEELVELEELVAKYRGVYYTVSSTGTVSISGTPSRAEIIPIIKEFDNILKNFT